MRKTLLHSGLVLSTALFFSTGNCFGQASQTVSEIITNYNTYFKSGTTAINPVKPDNSHDLLAFTFNGVRYSTGVNDALLTARGDQFNAQVFRALPISFISGVANGNTKIGLGQMYDKVDNGPSNPSPLNDMATYLTDGKNGLDLGTGVANLPAGKLVFNVGSINPLAIGDGIPDIIITQFADPSSGTDKYEFLTGKDVRVGKLIDISFSGVKPVANWTADFYEASKNPMVLSSGFTKTDRPIRLWAADFSFFGITTSNFQDIQKFVINLDGSSDVAFVAYNAQASFSIVPLTQLDFTATHRDKDIKLKWKAPAAGIKTFIVERSVDGVNFKPVAEMAGSGTGSAKFDFTDQGLAEGIYYYRLRMMNRDGGESVSKIIREAVVKSSLAISIFPNPAVSEAIVRHPLAKKGDKIQIYNSSGIMLQSVLPEEGSSYSRLAVGGMSRGRYLVRFISPAGTVTSSLILQ